ncbi:MAG: uracil-DNA glycosylase family protein [Gaiellaceae bacterium]
MATEQVNIRLDDELLSALERVAREESLDRATAIRRLLETSVRQWELEHAIVGYRRGDLSLGRAAEESGLTQWELTDALRAAGLAYPLDAAATRRRLAAIDGGGAVSAETLSDIPPGPGGVLLVGINPAPISVAAGHYYQGRLGRRLWRRLARLGLLDDPTAGAEDEAFARAGHGLTDLVKRATENSAELRPDELESGAVDLRAKVREWKPGLVVFVFRKAAIPLVGPGVKPGLCGEIEGVPGFLLSGPYAPREETERIDAELTALLGKHPAPGAGERTQRVTDADLNAGRIRLPRKAKRFFPSNPGKVEIVLRGTRLTARYQPRTGPDRPRSGVLSVPRVELSTLVRPNEVLIVSRGLGGTVKID